VGVVIGALQPHGGRMRGDIAMLSIHPAYKRRGVGSELVRRLIRRMKAQGAQEIVLETEVTNHLALKLYERMGFIRDKRLSRYYCHGDDAYRLKLWLS
ncbi:acyl-CoA N-acyltransferase, partial [Caulochytrium protostelioides]